MTYLSIQKYIFLLTIAFLVSMPSAVFADEIRLDTTKTEVRVGEEFVVSAVVHTNELVNAVEGRITFPSNLLNVKEVRDGNSIINFWIEKPHTETETNVVFSGITPGGFSGANQLLFSVVFVAKETGSANIGFEGLQALKNDGVGTKVDLTTHTTLILIKDGDSAVRKEKLMDTEPPEDFTPTVTQDPTIFDGKYFLVFATQDKGSGIDHYEIREGEWGWFRNVESPYRLKHQQLDKNIYIKAIDKTGNERVTTLAAQNNQSWWEQYAILGILILIAGVLLKILWSRFIK